MRKLTELPIDGYWRKLARLSNSPDSRIARTDHKGLHDTSYVLLLSNGLLFPIRVRTESIMEVS